MASGPEAAACAKLAQVAPAGYTCRVSVPHAPFRIDASIWLCQWRKVTGVLVSAPIRLSDEDIAYLLTLLRNASQPVTTQQLIDALRGQASRG